MKEDTSQFQGTMSVDDRQRFDTRVLADYLRGKLPEQGPTIEVEQFRGGQSNPTFKLLTGSRSYVMRSKPGPKARLLPSAHAIEREYRIQKALAQTGVPVAQMYCLCEDESIIGRAFYIMEHVEGRVLWDQELPQLSFAERGAVYDQMNQVLAALHQVDHQALGLADFGRPGNDSERQISRWIKQYRASETSRIESMERLIEWLPQHVPASEETTIVHGDFRLDNLIFDAAKPQIRAVLDWELSTLGAPLADFSYHCMGYRIDPGLFRGIQGIDFKALGIPDEAEYRASYCRRTGRSRIEHWDFYLAYNMFRLAAILQGIMKRALDGTASNQAALDSGRRAGFLADLGWNLAQRI